MFFEPHWIRVCFHFVLEIYSQKYPKFSDGFFCWTLKLDPNFKTCAYLVGLWGQESYYHPRRKLPSFINT